MVVMTFKDWIWLLSAQSRRQLNQTKFYFRPKAVIHVRVIKCPVTIYKRTYSNQKPRHMGGSVNPID